MNNEKVSFQFTRKPSTFPKKWSQREKKIILSILRNRGHSVVQQFVEALPRRSKRDVVKYLNNKKRIASKKLRKKHQEAQFKLQKIHQWLPFINLNHDDEANMHKNLVAYILPLLEKYVPYSPRRNYGGVNFRLAIRFIFNSLHDLPIPSKLNDETMTFIFFCHGQILNEIRRATNESLKTFNSSIIRLINEEKKPISNDVVQKIFNVPEINPFCWEHREIEILCVKKV